MESWNEPDAKLTCCAALFNRRESVALPLGVLESQIGQSAGEGYRALSDREIQAHLMHMKIIL